MAAPYENADAIVLEFQSEQVSFETVGTLPGVRILYVRGSAPLGVGRLRQTGNKTQLSWSPPGQSTFGLPIDVSAGGEFILEQASAPEQLVRVHVEPSYLEADSTGNVYLRIRRNNELAGADVTAAEAAAGVPLAQYPNFFRNKGTTTLDDVRVWFDPTDASYVELDESGSGSGPWVRPTTEAAALQFGSMAAGGLNLLRLRKNRGAAWSANPGLDIDLIIAFTNGGTRYEQHFRGAFRVFNDALYRFYRRLDEPPQESDTPFDTSPTLPYESTVPFTDGRWFLAVDYFNGVLSSGFRPIGPNDEPYRILEIVGGTQFPQRPQAPTDFDLFAAAFGQVNVRGTYSESGATRADEWALAYAQGVNPPKDSPDETFPITDTGLAVLQTNIINPSPGHAQDWRVRLQTRKNYGTDDFPQWVYSADDTVRQVYTDAQGPQGPTFGAIWQGQTPLADQ